MSRVRASEIAVCVAAGGALYVGYTRIRDMITSNDGLSRRWWMPKEQTRCHQYLESYVKCMEAHQNQAPAPYELEWCAEEKTLYNDCMTEFLDEKNKNK